MITTRKRSKPLINLSITLFLTLVSASYANAASLNKTFAPDTIGPGSVTTIIFTISNFEQPPVTGLAFTDVLPTVPGDVVIADPANATTDCVEATLSAPDGGDTISLSGARLGANEFCIVTVDVTAGTPGVHTNPAIMLTWNELDDDPPTSSPADLTVDTSLPGFSKSFAPGTVAAGGRSRLTFMIDNSLNDSPMTNLDFTDTLPVGMEIAGPSNASTSCGTAVLPALLIADTGTNLIWFDHVGIPTFPTVAAGAICDVTVDVIATGSDDLHNISGNLKWTDGSFVERFIGRASATLGVTVTPLAIRKSFTDDPVAPGNNVTLEFVIDNFDRFDPATGVAFSDDLTTLVPALAGLTFDSLLSNDCGGSVTGAGGGTTIGFSGGTLGPESACTIRVSLNVPPGAAPGVYTNTTGTVTATVGGSPVVGNMTSDELYVEPVPLLVKEFLGDPINAGDDVVLRFTVTNTSTTSGATDIEFIDELTDGSGGFPPDYSSGFLPFPVTVTLPPVPDPPCGAGSSLALIAIPGTSDRQGLELTGGSLAAAGMPDDSCTFEVTVSIPSTLAAGTYLNTTEEITATVDGATRTGRPASDTLTVFGAPSLSKAFTDDPVAPGGTVTLEFTLSYSPNASGDATGISFTDDLAPVLTNLIATGLPLNEACDPDGPGGDPGTGTLSGSAGDTLLTFMGGVLEPGETCTFSVTLDVPVGAAPGTYTNTTSGVSATVGGLAATSAAASDDLSVTGLNFTKEFLGNDASNPALPGETLTLRFTIDNVHPTDDATITFFTDNLAADLPGLAATGGASLDTCGGSLSGTTFLIYVGGSVMSGDSCTIEVEVQVPPGAADGTYLNVTSSLLATQGGSISVDPATDELTVNSNLIGLSKAFTDDPVAPGDPVTLEITLTNLDADRSASMIAFTDDLGAALAGLTFDSVLLNDCGATVAGTGTDMVTVTGASLTAGGSCTIRVSLTVPGATAASIYTNTTSGVTGEIDGFVVTGDAASDTLEVVQLLDFSKSFDGPTTATGTATLTFTITNPGADTASGLGFTDDLDAVITGMTATTLPPTPCGAGSSITGSGFLTFTGGELPPMGGTCSFSVEVTVPDTAAAGTYPNTSSELSQAGITVAEPATADLVIEPPPTFTKVFMPDAIFAGDTTTLSFTIDNSASAVAASSLAFTDNLPASVTVATPSVTANTCGGTLTATAGAFVISLSGGSVATGVTCTIDVDVTSSTVGAHVNTTEDLNSSSGNSGTATDTLSVSAAAGLSVTKSDGVTSATPGGSVVYTIVAANAGPSTDPMLALADTFPSPPLTCTYTSVAAGGATGNTAAGAGDLAETLSMPAGSTVTYTVTCDIDSDATGTLSNTVTITPSITDTSPGDNTATDNDTVLVPEADLSVTKSDGVTTAVPGQTTLTYTIVATNNGLSDDPSVSLTDSFPADLSCSHTSVAAGGASGNTSGSGDLAETLSMPAGSSVTYTVTCTIDPAATGTLSNTATIAGSVNDPDTGNDSATDDDTLLAPEADLSVTKSDGVTTAVPGQTTLTYTIVASNGGPSDEPSASLTDIFPADLTCGSYTSVAAGGATGNTAAGAGDLTETLAMPAGSSVTYTVDCTIDASATGTLSNTATVSGTVIDPDTGNNSATDADTVLAPEADLSVTKSDGVTAAVPGQTTLTYIIVASNNGPSDDPSVSLTDSFPADLTCSYTSVAAGGATGNTAGSGDLAETLSMPAGSSVTYTVNCTIAASATGTLSNTVTVSGSVTDPDSGNNSATDDDTVLAPETDLSLTKDDGVISVAPGGNLTYTLTVTNNGPSDSSGGTVTDVLPAGLSFVSSADCAEAAGTVTCAVGALAVGASQMVSFTASVSPAQSTPIVNTASVAANENDPVSGNDSASHSTSLLPGFAKSFTPDTVLVGEASTLTFDIDNGGGLVDATGLAFTDNLPAGVVVATPAVAVNSCGGTLTAVAGAASISLGSGSVAAGATCSISVDVTSSTAGAHVNLTSALTSSLGNSGTATATLNVMPADAPLLSKQFLPAGASPGDSITLEFTITNGNPFASIDGLSFTDDLDAVIPGMAATDLPMAGVCGPGSTFDGTGLLSFSGGSLGPASSCTFSATVLIPVDTPPGLYTNTTSELVYDDPGAAPSPPGGESVDAVSAPGTSAVGAAAQAPLQVVLLPVIEKLFLTDPVEVGATVDLQFTITNPDPNQDASGIAFSDDLDAMIPGLVATGLPQNDVCGAGSQLTGDALISLAGGNLVAGASCQFTVTLQVPVVAAGVYVNTTSTVTAILAGLAVDGEPATDDLELVYPEVEPIPTLSNWALLLTMLLLTAVAYTRRRRIGTR